MLIISILLKIFIIVLCFIFLSFILLMVIPFEYNLNFQISENISFGADISWMFRFIKVNVTNKEPDLKINLLIGNKRFWSIKPSKTSANNKNKKVKRKKTRSKSKGLFNINVLKYLISYFRDVLKIIRPRGIEIKGEYGFSDPSMTGFLCGIVPIISEIFPFSSLQLQPVFDDETMNIQSRVWGKIILFFIVFRTLKVILKKEIRKILFKRRKTIET